MKVTVYAYWVRPPYDTVPRLDFSGTDLKGHHIYPSIDLPPVEVEIDTACPHPSQFDTLELDLLRQQKAKLYQELMAIDEKIGKLQSLPNYFEESAE